MKIAMIGHKRIPSREGGIEIVVSEISKRMVNLGHSVTAYNRKSRHIAGKEFESERNDEWEGVNLKWIYTPDSSKLNAIVYSTLSTLNAVFCDYDVIHYHAEGPSALIPVAKLFKKRCVVTVHGLDWQRAKWGGFATKFLKFGEKMAAKYADEIIVLSQNNKEYFKNVYNRNTVFIPNGISKVKSLSPDIIKEKYSLEKDSYILFLGRIVPEKGVHYLINAYKKINTDKRLVIAGGASHSGEYENDIKELAKNDSRIIFTGFVQGNELEELFSNAYIYVLPSDIEGMPISLLEGMAYSNCCLTSDINECSEVCEDRAEYFKQGDEESLKEKIEELLNSPEKVAKMKNEAADFILDKYNWDDVVSKTLELYKK